MAESKAINAENFTTRKALLRRLYQDYATYGPRAKYIVVSANSVIVNQVMSEGLIEKPETAQGVTTFGITARPDRINHIEAEIRPWFKKNMGVAVISALIGAVAGWLLGRL